MLQFWLHNYSLRTLRTTEMYVVNNGTFMYAKHGKLVDADASAPKPVQNTFESCLEVVQGHTFCDHWKADKRLRITVE